MFEAKPIKASRRAMYEEGEQVVLNTSGGAPGDNDQKIPTEGEAKEDIHTQENGEGLMSELEQNVRDYVNKQIQQGNNAQSNAQQNAQASEKGSQDAQDSKHGQGGSNEDGGDQEKKDSDGGEGDEKDKKDDKSKSKSQSQDKKDDDSEKCTKAERAFLDAFTELQTAGKLMGFVRSLEVAKNGGVLSQTYPMPENLIEGKEDAAYARAMMEMMMLYRKPLEKLAKSAKGLYDEIDSKMPAKKPEEKPGVVPF